MRQVNMPRLAPPLSPGILPSHWPPCHRSHFSGGMDATDAPQHHLTATYGTLTAAKVPQLTRHKQRFRCLNKQQQLMDGMAAPKTDPD
ncbi:hypothetical protein VTJ04DRAFT_4393 [Mycothermus thermophilus]|uniref:uncharacterized protein n=1 Tax=Humicola insolens TaxID=85995 RepID=UPI003744A260